MKQPASLSLSMILIAYLLSNQSLIYPADASLLLAPRPQESSMNLQNPSQTDPVTQSLDEARALRPSSPPFISGGEICNLAGVLLALDRVEQEINDISATGTCELTFIGSCTNTIVTFTSVIITLTGINLNCEIIPVTEPGTLSSPGSYCLANDIDGTIVITADDVTFDLNNHTISNSSSGIIIDPGTNRTIKNGRIDSHSDSGILATNSTALTIENIIVTNCGTLATDAGVRFDGPCINCTLNQLITNSCTSGIALNGPNSLQIEIKNFSLFNNTLGNGILVFSADNIIIKKGFIIGALNGISATALNALLIDSVSIDDCSARGILVSNGVATTLSNITIDSSLEGIILEASSRGLLNKCSVVNSGDAASITRQAIGVFNSSTIELVECSVKNYLGGDQPRAISISGCQDVTLQDCTCQNLTAAINSPNGIQITTCNSVTSNNCIVNTVTSPSTFANGFFISASNNIDLSECGVISCVAAGNGVGFSVGSGNTNLSYCFTSSCVTGSGGAFNISTADKIAPVSLQYCQSNFNVGDGYFLSSTSDVYITIGNSIAIGNTRNGFNAIGATPPVLYRCFSSRNGSNEYTGTIANINNASDQVDPSILLPNGPFAAGNIQITP